MAYRGTVVGGFEGSIIEWRKAGSPGEFATLENPLAVALRSLNLEGAGDGIKTLMMDTVIGEALEVSKATAPVSHDRVPGELRDAIYKEVVPGRYLIRGKVAIPASIPYGPAVVYGDKRHPNPNRFMEIALNKALEYLNGKFADIVKAAFSESRGK